MVFDSDGSGPLPKVPKNPVTSVATVPASIAGYAIDGDEGIEDLARGVKTRAMEEPYSKFDAAYVPQTPYPPGLWDYKCATCRFYQPNGDGQSKCSVVGEEDDPFGGAAVHPEAWCGLWLPMDGQGWFDWVTDRLEGEAPY